MKSQLLCEKILIILKYSGVAPFNINREFTINKNFFYISRVLIGVNILILSIAFTFLFPLIEKPSLYTFGTVASSLFYAFVVSLMIISSYNNHCGICSLLNEIVKRKEKLIIMFNKNFRSEKTWLAYSCFVTVQVANIIFFSFHLIVGFKSLGVEKLAMSFFLCYYIACYDTFYTMLALNVFHLFKALIQNISVVIERQKDAYNEKLSQVEALEIKAKVLKMIMALYVECNKILNIVERVDHFFGKLNFLSISNTMLATVFTTFACFSDDGEFKKNEENISIFSFFGMFFITKSIMVLYFSWITTLKVNFLIHV